MHINYCFIFAKKAKHNCFYFSFIIFNSSSHTHNQAEWQGNDNRKTMLKVKTTGQILPFEKRHDLPSPSQAPGSTLHIHNFVTVYPSICAYVRC